METVYQPTFFNFENISKEFKRGENFSVTLSEKLHSFMSVDETKYIDKIQNVKQVLNKGVYKSYGQLTCIYCNIEEEDYVYVVRYFNLSLKGEKIIMINGKIVYIPPNLGNASYDEVIEIVKDYMDHLQYTKLLRIYPKLIYRTTKKLIRKVLKKKVL